MVIFVYLMELGLEIMEQKFNTMIIICIYKVVLMV